MKKNFYCLDNGISSLYSLIYQHKLKNIEQICASLPLSCDHTNIKIISGKAVLEVNRKKEVAIASLTNNNNAITEEEKSCCP